MHIIIKQIFTLTISVLFLIGFILITGTIFYTWKSPDRVISFINYLHPTPTPSPFTIKGMGILGDSQSDEYRADDNRGLTYATTTLNWVEQLAKYRQINIGLWGTYDEPRRTGYAYNFSRSGATVNSLLVSGQHTQLAELVKQNKVNLVIIFIGGNDFAPYITDDGYEKIYNTELSDADILKKTNRIVADITTIIDTIKQAGSTKILLVKIPDWKNHSGIQIAFPLPYQRNRVTNAITTTNEKLEKVAKEKQIVTVDPNNLYANLLNNSTNGEITVGNITLNKLIPNNNPESLILEDGVHTGTVFNGLFANFIINNLNSKIGTNIKPFSEKEIKKAAGL